jgi:hypothetical protein
MALIAQGKKCENMELLKSCNILQSRITSSALVSNTLSEACSHLSSIHILSAGATDQVLHPYKTVVKVTILYTPIFEPTTQ